jgi:hypothetical protein
MKVARYTAMLHVAFLKRGPGRARPDGRQGRPPKSGYGTEGSHAAAGVNVQLNEQQRTEIRTTVINAHGAPRVSHVDFDVTVGTVVPRERTVMRTGWWGRWLRPRQATPVQPDSIGSWPFAKARIHTIHISVSRLGGIGPLLPVGGHGSSPRAGRCGGMACGYSGWCCGGRHGRWYYWCTDASGYKPGRRLSLC